MCARGTGSELRATGGAQAGPLRPAPPRPRPARSRPPGCAGRRRRWARGLRRRREAWSGSRSRRRRHLRGRQGRAGPGRAARSLRPGCGSVAGGMLPPGSKRPILQTPARPHTKLCPAPVLSFPNGIVVRPPHRWMTWSNDTLPQVRAPEVRGQSATPAPLAAVSGPPWARHSVPTGPGVAQVPRVPES